MKRIISLMLTLAVALSLLLSLIHIWLERSQSQAPMQPQM